MSVGCCVDIDYVVIRTGGKVLFGVHLGELHILRRITVMVLTESDKLVCIARCGYDVGVKVVNLLYGETAYGLTAVNGTEISSLDVFKRSAADVGLAVFAPSSGMLNLLEGSGKLVGMAEKK